MLTGAVYCETLRHRQRKEIVMPEFFFRDGRALSERENLTVQIGARGTSGFITQHGPCSRCGGAGGSHAWRFTGYTCYRCGGRNSPVFETYTPRVFTEARLAQLNEAEAKREAKRKAAHEAKEVARHLEFVQWGREHKDLLGAIQAAEGNTFLADLASKLADNYTLSDRQLDAAAAAILRDSERKAENAASEYVGEVKVRMELTLTVLGVFDSEGHYGHTDIVKMKDAEGNLFTWFASGWSGLTRGDVVTGKGTVKAHDTYKGTKQTVLTRCKFETINQEAVA
jgi:hypothetical protein